jgi:phage terminase small subunit
MPGKAKGLTPKEEIFVREFLATGNATKSAIAAGYSRAAASVMGSRLLRKVKVSEELARLREEIAP